MDATSRLLVDEEPQDGHGSSSHPMDVIEDLTERKKMSRNCFAITFTGEFLDDDPTMAVGLIQLGDFRESFCAAPGYWTLKEYEESWDKALLRLINGASTSCLITSLTDPRNTNFLTTWPLYRFGDEVFVQNRLLFLAQLSHAFDPAAPWESMAPYSAVDEDGRNISEWQIQLTDLREFLDQK